jgi:hypothetical protein
MDESMCTAMKDGLGMNETLETLQLFNIHLTEDNAAFWCRALSFLRTTKSLKSLSVSMQRGVTESCVSAFCFDIAAMLEENTSLVSLCIHGMRKNIKAEDYIALVTTLHHNTTLKRLFSASDTTLQLTADEDKRMAVLLRNNYALESLSDIDLENEPGDVGAMLRLNAAGRRYLIEDGSSISKGIEVLIRVNDDINCVFLHLLENPRLCDRSAVEIASSGESDGSSTNPNASF